MYGGGKEGNKWGRRDAAEEWEVERWYSGGRWGNQAEETVISDI